MRLRLFAALPAVLLLVLLLPAADVTAPDPADAATVVDEIVGLDGGGKVPPGAEPPVDGPVSRVTRAPIRFTMLAFTTPADAEVAFRTSADGTTWSGWTVAPRHADSGPDQGSAEAFAAAPDHRRSGEPVWVGEAEWLQVAVTHAPLADVEVDLIDSMGLSRPWWRRARDAFSDAPAEPGTQARQTAGRPAIVSRAEWGADESLRSGEPAHAPEARFAILHHTGGANEYTREEAAGIVRGIYAYHTRSRGWSDIGYNFLVDRFGTVYEGRAGGIDRAVIGAHAAGFNAGAIGVAVIGSHDTAAIPGVVRRAVTDLLAWKFALHGIAPDGSVELAGTCVGQDCAHPRGTTVERRTLFGHRGVGNTVCPGEKGAAAVKQLRADIAAAADEGRRSATARSGGA